VHALTRHLTAIRSVFQYAYDVDLMDRPMKFGKGFANPTAVQKRKAKQRAETQNGKKLFTANELRAILNACDPALRASVLLGINGGFGNTDCATLPRSGVDLEAGLIAFPRPKTEVQRVIPLWPETLSALRQVLETARARPADDMAAALVFLTPRKRPLVRQNLSVDEETGGTKAAKVDALTVHFAALLTSLGIHRRGIGFCTLGHTFRTWADETHDQRAIHRIMGHAIPGMSGIYVEEISLDRVRAVVDYVRRKLWPDAHEDRQVLSN